MTPDPLVLFPGAEICCITEVTLATTGCAILIDGLAHHDPEGLGRPFDRYSNAVVVRNAAGSVLLADRGSTDRRSDVRTNLPARTVPRRRHVLVLATDRNAAMRSFWKVASPRCGCMAGFSKLPNNAGIGGRVLAANGGALARGLEAAFAVAFEALMGVPRRAGASSWLIQRTPKLPSLNRRPSAARLPPMTTAKTAKSGTLSFRCIPLSGSRHCEERQRRSNPASAQAALDCFADARNDE